MKMVDIHYHLLPDVDDGPDTTECALEMVKISYDQGVRGIVATPHLNHPVQFRGRRNKEMDNKKDMEQAFETLRAHIHEAYPDMEIYLGAELYLTRKDLDHLEHVKIRTMNTTQYILVEFSRDITHIELDHGMHELVLLGYRPILAHAEVYKCYANHMEELIKLRDQGILIQCNAGNIINPQSSPEKTRATQMLEQGLIDIIASDGHNISTRRPDMAKAYTYVTKKHGAKEANRLFCENPQTMLLGGVVPQPPSRKKTLQPKHKSLVGMTSLIALALIGFSLIVTNALNAKDESPEAFTLKSLEQQTEPASTTQIEKNHGPVLPESLESTEENLLTQQENNELEQAQYSEDLKIPTMNIENEINPEQQGYNKIVSAYEQHLTNLEAYYRTQVDQYFIRLKEAVQIQDIPTRDETVSSIQGLIGKLESQSDNEVYKSLYDMQNDLEAKQYDVAIVQQLRDRYNEVKATVSTAYQAELEAYYNKQ
ncbi:putative Tyrosine-protein phosphatase YwqE [Petrocella atlantisensis]|uniref:protein-tyrosine-phosphatase n=1 Tax=Petrocella atlantisensis TaxID=2173034 RepID=A0A3P7NTP7_9FIRM|nr:CpsB/CapC family capsule biosynthesis tyrosine phosphatase [Petrocella atlantisensis]VDN46225.1 putative Tyrosine-protein phosphatase YwqE [Petrocella atlantisensis]